MPEGARRYSLSLSLSPLSVCPQLTQILQALESVILPIQTSSAPFVPPAFTQEIRGLSDATGWNATRLLWLHLFPETSGGHCSMYGAWGSATRHSPGLGGELLQMRALDYNVEGFLTDNHALTIYHKSNTSGFDHTVSDVGFVGMVSMVSPPPLQPLAFSRFALD